MEQKKSKFAAVSKENSLLKASQNAEKNVTGNDLEPISNIENSAEEQPKEETKEIVSGKKSTYNTIDDFLKPNPELSKARSTIYITTDKRNALSMLSASSEVDMVLIIDHALNDFFQKFGPEIKKKISAKSKLLDF